MATQVAGAAPWLEEASSVFVRRLYYCHEKTCLKSIESAVEEEAVAVVVAVKKEGASQEGAIHMTLAAAAAAADAAVVVVAAVTRRSGRSLQKKNFVEVAILEKGLA